MKKKIFITLILSNSFLFLTAQRFAISLDKMNIFYTGVDNPVTIAVENLSNKLIIVKTTNGKIRNAYGQYVFFSNQPGKTSIILYKKVNGKIKEIGRNYFRILKIPDPTFKIGSGKKRIPLPELQSQQYVRADMDGDFGCDIRFSVVSFTVSIISSDPCRYVELNNVGNKISDEMKAEFGLLKPNDILIFKNIICNGPGGTIDLSSEVVTLTK